MNHEAIEQAAKKLYPTVGWGHPDDPEQKSKQEGFIAGASWREQQAASGFEEWVVKTFNIAPELVQEFKYSFIHKLMFTEKAWAESQISNAKLLAEKEAEIKMLRDLSVKSCVCLKLSDELSQAKELLVEKDAEIKKLNFIISFVLFNTRSNYVDKESRELFKKLTKDFEPAISWNEFVKENAEKIKALLGEG